MKNLFVMTIALLVAMTGMSQKFYTKNGQINFDATSPASPEKIEGINRSATCVVDTKSGNMQFAALMKGFAFERALMEEHFNENYVESDKYPKAEFKGEIKNSDKVDFTKDGNYTVKIKGKLTMHGESNDVETEAKISIQNGKIKATADLNVLLSDYKVSIPGLVADKVSKTVKISVSCLLEPLKS
ncbi:MAG: YceI family protein [Chitinophagaceae bacterium]|nr:YceI family protein [Chitinophagaceae bacterium]MBL0271729.1 YceI family protein [Chitinophagaceae bacterium]